MKLTNEKVRGLLSIIIISIFMIVTAAIMIHPLIVGDVDPDQDQALAARLNLYVSGFTGIIGVILGYYFGKTNQQQ